ncbi:glutamate--cysteine ligase [Salinisphaera hydrothermalis]|uniref:Glutamate--cysteine ligase n=1 Tax=Salinisphaera hydrothermalis (strain C41B8) TaxID=1304275 RepID=A0A084IJT5_SALHC|nr:glutamate--cysteine ligase [Salinisphaera hydrothermalis]KEZ76969.1 gamma-glutamylcysteine synthetase [Salinisphaera hydrothermalis C41B8]
MSAPSQSGGAPITDERQLVAYFEDACKPPSRWRLGTEHEKFVFDRDTLRPLPFDGDQSISTFLHKLQRFGWQPMVEDGRVVALEMGQCHITLEPGGQLELAGAPLHTIHETCDEIHIHLRQVKEVAAEMNVGLIGLGFQPKWPREDCPWMPKARYDIMKAYMPKVGTLGIDMMLRTSTVQVNLDYGSEADMIKKFRVGLALQPIATALFANSPFKEGKPNGFVSYRSHIWTDTDPDRCGMLDWVFEEDMGFERYKEFALDVPMYFVYRDGRYIDASGQSFRDFLAGKLPALPGERPTMGDWDDHLTTIFPEVRLKRFMEMRGADGGPWRRLCALPALWAGLCYDSVALDEAWNLVSDFTREERNHLRDQAPMYGLKTPFRGGTLGDIARETIRIAQGGLRRRAQLDSTDRDESMFLDQLAEIAETGVTPAEQLLTLYHGRWNESVDPVFEEFAY